MKGPTFGPYKILPRRVDKKFAIFSTDRAVAFVDLILGEWILECHGEADSATVAVCFMGCWHDL